MTAIRLFPPKLFLTALGFEPRVLSILGKYVFFELIDHLQPSCFCSSKEICRCVILRFVSQKTAKWFSGVAMPNGLWAPTMFESSRMVMPRVLCAPTVFVWDPRCLHLIILVGAEQCHPLVLIYISQWLVILKVIYMFFHHSFVFGETFFLGFLWKVFEKYYWSSWDVVYWEQRSLQGL